MNTIVVVFECPVWAHHGPCLAACCSHKKNSFHLVPFELCSLRSHFPVRTRYHKNSVCGPGIQNMLLQALGLGFQLLGRSTSSANVNTLLPLSQNKGSNSVCVAVSSSADWCWSRAALHAQPQLFCCLPSACSCLCLHKMWGFFILYNLSKLLKMFGPILP